MKALVSRVVKVFMRRNLMGLYLVKFLMFAKIQNMQ